MNSAYAMLHEAEHGMLHPNRRVNETVGTILALFFPAPFHLLRQGHLGHHLRNRSDDEAFDFYFEGENVIWKYWLLYGILTGGFWLCIALGNFLILLVPGCIKPTYTSFDRPTQALIESLNPRFQPLVRLEALLIVLLHGFLIWLWHIPLLNYFSTLFGFGFIWSAMQYSHHFGTVRHVQKGARNLRTLFLIDWLWLNHNWHLHHHMHPTVPWLYLPKIDAGPESKRTSFIWAYLRQWRGPRFTTERVENLYAGKIIK
jgi:fatty acid desaturase